MSISRKVRSNDIVVLYTDCKEKAAAWLVTTGMKAERKTGAGKGFRNIVGACIKAIKKSIKT